MIDFNNCTFFCRHVRYLGEKMLLRCTVLVLLVVYCSFPAYCQTTGDLSRFDVLMKSAAVQANVAVILEGSPTDAGVSVNRIPTNLSDSPIQRIQQLAEAFDYEIQPERPTLRRRPHVIAFRKRYTDVRDLPCITAEECVAALDAFEKATVKQLPPASANNPTHLANQIFESLTSDQRRELESNTLLVSSLRPDQRTLINSMARYIYIGTEKSRVAIPKSLLKNQSDLTLRLDEASPENFRIFCDYRPDATKPAQHFLLAAGHPPKNDVLRESEAPNATNKITLAQLLDRLLKMGYAKTKTASRTYAIDPSLVDKTVTVINAGKVEPAQLLYGVADVYGLRVVEPDSLNLLIAPPQPQAVTTLREIPNAIRQALPSPFLRAFRDKEQNQFDVLRGEVVWKTMETSQVAREVYDEGKKQGNVDWPRMKELGHQSEELGKQMDYVARNREELAKRSQLIRDAATEALYRALKTEQKKSGANTVAWSAPLEQAFVTLQMQPIAIYLSQEYSLALPEYIAHPDTVYLTGREYEQNGKTLRTVYLSVLDPTHKMRGEVGFIGADASEK